MNLQYYFHLATYPWQPGTGEFIGKRITEDAAMIPKPAKSDK